MSLIEGFQPWVLTWDTLGVRESSRWWFILILDLRSFKCCFLADSCRYQASMAGLLVSGFSVPCTSATNRHTNKTSQAYETSASVDTDFVPGSEAFQSDVSVSAFNPCVTFDNCGFLEILLQSLFSEHDSNLFPASRYVFNWQMFYTPTPTPTDTHTHTFSTFTYSLITSLLLKVNIFLITGLFPFISRFNPGIRRQRHTVSRRHPVSLMPHITGQSGVAVITVVTVWTDLLRSLLHPDHSGFITCWVVSSGVTLCFPATCSAGGAEGRDTDNRPTGSFRAEADKVRC